jgi:hypothetical protein
MAPPRVNAAYPDGGVLATMPRRLLQIVPELALVLEKGFIGRDVWDSHANLIIDFIPDAVLLSPLGNS